jgi:hypothetical protein
MTKQDLIKNIQNKFIDIKRHFISRQNVIEQSEKLLLKGFAEQNINNAYTINGLDMLSPFISNTNVRDTIKLIQQGMQQQQTAGKE